MSGVIVVGAGPGIGRSAHRFGRGTFLITGGVPVPVASHLNLSLGKAALRAAAAMLADHHGPHGVHVAIADAVVRGTAYDPDAIADHWRLHTLRPGQWQTEYLFEGHS